MNRPDGWAYEAGKKVVDIESLTLEQTRRIIDIAFNSDGHWSGDIETTVQLVRTNYE